MAIAVIQPVTDLTTVAYHVANTTTAIAETADWGTSVAVALSAGLSIYAAYSYLQIAEDYYDLYKEQRDFYYTNYQLGAESPFAAEVFAEPIYSPEYAIASGVLRNDMLGYSHATTDQFEGWYERKARMYHMKNFLDTATHTPQVLDRYAHEDDWLNYTFAREEHFRDVYNNRRFSRQLDSLNVGVKQGTAVERGLASSFGVLDDAFGTAGDFFATQANGLGRYAGYTAMRDQLEFAKPQYKARELPASLNGHMDNRTGDPVYNTGLRADQRLG